MSHKLSRRLTKLAEDVLVVEERLRRLSLANQSTRGDALDRAYRQGEYDGVCWVLSLVDMDMPWKDAVKQMEHFCSDFTNTPSLPVEPREDEEEDENDDGKDDG